jgi:hypothetical protein
MVDPTTLPAWMTHVALRISATCVLDLLGHARPQSDTAVKSTI